MKKWGLVFKVLAIVSLLILIKFGIDFLDLNFASKSGEWPRAISALVGGVVFTIAIIFAGVLADYKESEKIPGELAASIKALYKDSRVVHLEDKKLTEDLRSHTRELLRTINDNLRNNIWDLGAINAAMDALNEDISLLAAKGAAPQFVVKLRTELTNIDKISNRIKTITGTTFILAAYALAQLAVAAVLALLLFIKTEPYYAGPAIIGATSTLLIGILMLIKDMDNPFEVGKNTYADVDLSLLWQLEEDLK
ncbi:MAG: hypothetical protein EFT35_08400 [Methanophagales archaeon ANME-1-THS]|nr:MAG: hypothetical protein EFT35_08400 [Methanophagales archaeon ANME-1-THS]